MRIGYKMELAVQYIRANPGCTKMAVARYVMPQSNRYGYAVVNRTIQHGLVRAQPTARGYKLEVV